MQYFSWSYAAKKADGLTQKHKISEVEKIYWILTKPAKSNINKEDRFLDSHFKHSSFKGANFDE